MDMKVKPNTKQEIAVAISAPKFGTLEILLNGRAPLVVERFSFPRRHDQRLPSGWIQDDVG